MANIQWVGCHRNNYATGRNGNRVQYIVLHWIVGRLQDADSTFQNPNRKASATYGIGGDTIHQYVKETDTAYANSNLLYNYQAISIEHEGGWAVDTNRAKPTNKTHETSANLVADIAQRYGIPLDRRHIIGHREVPGAQTACPGTLDLDWIVNRAKQIQGNGGDEVSRRDAIKQMLQGFRGDNNVPDSLLDEKDASGVSIAQLTREQYVGYGKQYILDLWTGYYGHATDNQVADDKWPAGAIEAGKTLRANP